MSNREEFPCTSRPRVTKGCGSKNTVVYFVAYACALNRTLIFRVCKAESRKSEPSLSCVLGMNEPVKGALAHGVSIFPKYFCLLHCVPLYVCRLCINFQDLCARLLGMAALRILFLTFTSRFLIDFLSIRKVIIFSAIATDDRHPLRSRSIYQNAANCMMIRFRYIAQPKGVRKTYCARSRNDVRRLTSRSNGMPSKKIMESLRMFVAVETVLKRGRMFQSSDAA